MITCIVTKESRLGGKPLAVGDVVELEDGRAAEWRRNGRVRYQSEPETAPVDETKKPETAPVDETKKPETAPVDETKKPGKKK